MTGTLRNIILLSLLGFPAAAQVPEISGIRDACRPEMPVETCEAAAQALIGSDAAQADLAEAYRLRGLRYHGESGYDRQAIADYTAALEIEPRSNIYFNRAQLLRFSGDETGAFADLEEAVALHPGYGKAWVDISLILSNQERYREAIAAAHNALDRDPELSDRFKSMAWVNIGNASYRIGELETAEDALQRAIGFNPQNGGAHRHLTRVYILMKDRARAEEAFAAAREIDPYSPHNGSLEAALAGLD